MRALPPAVSVTAEIDPVGGLLACALTVTVNVTYVLVFPSLAVTVMVELPTATGVTVSVVPDRLTVT